MLDITNPATVAWLQARLAALLASDPHAPHETVFYLETGSAQHTPQHASFDHPLPNPDLYMEHFIHHIMQTVKVIGVSGAASERPKAPAFVWLSPLESSWESLKSIVPNMLNLGIIGYPFINPGPIGGVVSPRNNNSNLPELELYLRWWQLATFLPQLHFTIPPTAYSRAEIAGAARALRRLRERTVAPLLINLTAEAMERSVPLVRPLWLLQPRDPLCLTIQDQFLLGDSLLVAPVLQRGVRARRVYLPATPTGPGVWKRGTDGAYFRGGQWLNSPVALDEVLYFERKPDRARPGHKVR